jgi:AAA15 family ATPase/GTPase
MIKTLTINNFKKYQHMTFDNLQQFNIFLGVNNVGKTSILEAIMGFACGYYFSSMLNLSIIDRLRYQAQGLSTYQLAELVLNTFHNYYNKNDLTFSFKGKVIDEKNKVLEKEFIHSFEPGQLLSTFLPNAKIIVNDTSVIHQKIPMPFQPASGSQLMMDITAQYLGNWVISSGKEKKEFKLLFPMQFNQFSNEKPFMPAIMHDIISYRNISEFLKVYSHLMSQNVLDNFIKEINQAFNGLNIKSIDNIPYPDGSQAPISFRLTNGTRYPLYTLGDGVQRWFNLLGYMIAYPNAIHCIEESDVTFHHEAQNGFSTNLKHYAKKYNNQIFITTHNEEFLKTFLNGLGKEDPEFLKDSVRIITLRNFKTIVKQRTLDGLEALGALKSGLELRK